MPVDDELAIELRNVERAREGDHDAFVPCTARTPRPPGAWPGPHRRRRVRRRRRRPRRSPACWRPRGRAPPVRGAVPAAPAHGHPTRGARRRHASPSYLTAVRGHPPPPCRGRERRRRSSAGGRGDARVPPAAGALAHGAVAAGHRGHRHSTRPPACSASTRDGEADDLAARADAGLAHPVDRDRSAAGRDRPGRPGAPRAGCCRRVLPLPIGLFERWRPAGGRRERTGRGSHPARAPRRSPRPPLGRARAARRHRGADRGGHHERAGRGP